MFIFFFCLNNVQYVIYGNSANKQWIEWIELVWVAPLESTNVQPWPQDPYFSDSFLVLHFFEVWKCERTLLSFLIPSSTPVKGLSKEWQGVHDQGKSVTIYILTLSDFSTLPHLWEVWNYVKNNKGFVTGGNVRHYPDFVRLFHTSTPLNSVELSKEWQGVRATRGKVGDYSHFVRLFTTSSTPSEKCGTK